MKYFALLLACVTLIHAAPIAGGACGSGTPGEFAALGSTGCYAGEYHLRGFNATHMPWDTMTFTSGSAGFQLTADGDATYTGARTEGTNDNGTMSFAFFEFSLPYGNSQSSYTSTISISSASDQNYNFWRLVVPANIDQSGRGELHDVTAGVLSFSESEPNQNKFLGLDRHGNYLRVSSVIEPVVFSTDPAEQPGTLTFSQYQFTYQGTIPDSSVPEPSTWALVGGGAALVLIGKKRR